MTTDKRPLDAGTRISVLGGALKGVRRHQGAFAAGALPELDPGTGPRDQTLFQLLVPEALDKSAVEILRKVREDLDVERPRQREAEVSAYVDMLMGRCLFDGPGLHGPELCCARSQRVMTAQMRRPSGPVSVPHPVTG